jgi:hypothetical protein
VTILGDHTPPAAARATRPGWRDPRLWIGVAIVALSVVAGSRLLAAADDTVIVWAAVEDLAGGAEVNADDLEARRVRFAEAADHERYFTADDPLPEDARLVRGVGRGELLPRAAVGTTTDDDVLELPIPVDLVPDSVGPGSVVNVYVRDTVRCPRCAGPALESVAVVDAPAADELTGVRQLVLAVEPPAAEEWFELLATLETPVVTVVGS